MKHAWRKLPIGAAASLAIVLLLFPGASRAQMAKPVWPMFGHDPAHTGQSPYRTGAGPGKIKWTFAVPFPTASGQTGMQWVQLPAIGADGTLYAGVSGRWGGLYAVNPDGTQKWVFAPGRYGFRGPPPAIGSDGTIYLPTDTGNLDAVNPDGTLKWAFPILFSAKSAIMAPSAGAGQAPGTIYLSNADGTLYAISPAGSLKWKVAADPVVGIENPAIGPDGTVYVCGQTLYAFTPGGALKWTRRIPASNSSRMLSVGADGTVYVGSGSWFDGNVTAVKPDGTLKWVFPGGVYFNPPAIGADGTVYATSGDHNLYAINSDGSLLWKFDAGSDFGAAPAIGADGTIFVNPSGATLFAIGPDGRPRWTVPGAGQSAPAIGADGTVYVGTGAIVAVGTDTPPLGTSIWLSPVLAFGSEKVGGNKVKKVDIKNTGNAPLFIAGVTSSDAVEFRPGYSDCPAAGLSPNAKCDIAVSFVPAVNGKLAATLTISGNAPVQTVKMSGIGH
ncbi:MAG TPA: PQQ-binding-like beta-propeller repeat protein [Candidatus Binataceae bacterium]|nr:PQQ-binding-like beta-propeller repeat protein [Candidatus Binataceae bacterium]